MRNAVILGKGEFPRKEYPRMLLRQAEFIVCCDGALASFLRCRDGIFPGKREPDVIIGDLDSLSPALRKRYADRIVPVDEQETNDQTKAFHYLVSRFPELEAIHILAGTGKREDHTVGNMSLLMEYARECGACGDPADGAPYLDMVSDYATIFAVTDSCELSVGEGRAISLFSPDRTLNIKSSGLVWPTDGVVFDNWWKATLNRASEDVVRLDFSCKSLALIVLN